MIWKTKNCNGESVTWISNDEIKDIYNMLKSELNADKTSAKESFDLLFKIETRLEKILKE